MNIYIKLILNHRKTVITIFLIAMVICLIMAKDVSVNYNLADYLPDNAPSTKALNVMDEQFDKKAPNARAMIQNVSISEALDIKRQIAEVDGVDDITWLDDAINIYQPIEYIPQKTVEAYYIDSSALFNLTIDDNKKIKAIDKIREIIGDEGALSGTSVDSATSIKNTDAEINKIVVLAIFIIILVLIITTKSWFEPVLFMVPIGIAIALNMGTNLILGEISFVTKAAGSLLQLAVSIDYSIFLLNRFAEEKDKGMTPREAMESAIKKAFSAVMSSGLATGTGFAALILMNFKIGPDMGIVLTKAIGLSLICVLVFLPAFTLEFHKFVEKSYHRPFIPPFDKFGNVVVKVGVPSLIILCILLVPCYLAGKSNDFVYGSSGIYGPNTKAGQDTALINNTFKKNNLMVLMVPNNSLSKEKSLSDELEEMEKVTSVVSYAKSVGVQIPTEFVPKDTISQLISKEYSRMVITVEADDESEEAFAIVEEIRKMASNFYGDNYLLVGNTVNSYDMKEIITKDSKRVDAASIGAIALILLFSFKSLSMPVILLFVIEASVYINMSVPYFAGSSLFYIGYLIVSSVQLGATVDYAILFGERYVENRKTLPKIKAAKKTLSDTSVSILTSAGILSMAGALLGVISTHGVISQLGTLIGRGVLLSLVLILLVLPTILVLLDDLLYKTSYKLEFYKEVKTDVK